MLTYTDVEQEHSRQEPRMNSTEAFVWSPLLDKSTISGSYNAHQPLATAAPAKVESAAIGFSFLG